MSTCVQVEPVVERRYGGVGRCKCSFWFAVAHDVLGVFIMLVGAFGGLPVHDLFIYVGAIIIFLSLIWWVFWYSGNIDVPPEELEDDVGLLRRRERRLSRVVSRLSGTIRSSLRKKARWGGGGRTPSADPDASPLPTIYGGTAAPTSKDLVRETLSV